MGKSVLPTLKEAHPTVYALIRDAGDFSSLSIGAGVKLTWECVDCGDTYERRVSYVVEGRQRCNSCSRRIQEKSALATKLETGKSVADYKAMLAYWDYSKNSARPSDVLARSRDEFWWKCESGHSWLSSAHSRKEGRAGCGWCSNRVFTAGINDLATLFPQLVQEWDFERNSLDPSQLRPGSREEVFWLCKQCSYSWKKSVVSRTSRGTSCPQCVTEGVNAQRRQEALTRNGSLAETHPALANQWDWDKNQILPSATFAGALDEVWLVCQACRQSSLYKTVPKPKSKTEPLACLECRPYYSFLEKDVKRFLEAIYDQPIEQHVRSITNPATGRCLEMDFYLPDLKLGFEVQDLATHSRTADDEEGSYRGWTGVKRGPSYHELKKSLAEEQLGVKLVEIWEDDIRGSHRYQEQIAQAIAARAEELTPPSGTST